RPGPLYSGDSQPVIHRAGKRGTHGHECTDPGDGGGHPEAGHDCPRRQPARRCCHAADGSRRDRDRGSESESGEGGWNRERDDGEHLSARGAAGGGYAVGQKLVRSKRLIAIVALVACSKPIAKLPQRAISAALEPTVPATVITIQTSLQPQNRTVTHSIVIADNRARSD